MLERIIRFSVAHRWLMLLLVLAFAVLGGWSFTQLPIDATPDITNVQVQINTQAAGFSALEAEQRVTFPIETALAGLARLEGTRSLSRYGLSQVTVVFDDGTDIYFARQQVAERLQQVRSQLPAGLEPELGPVATGLGEIFVYSVDAAAGCHDVPMAEQWTATDLRTLQDWVVRPQLRTVRGVTDVNTIGGYERQIHVTPDPARLIAYGFTLQDVVAAVGKNDRTSAPAISSATANSISCACRARSTDLDAVRDIVLSQRDGVPVRVGDVATVGDGDELRTGAATENGRGSRARHGVHADRREQSRSRRSVRRERLSEVQKSLPAGVKVNAGLRPHGLGRSDDRHRPEKPARRRAARDRRAVPVAGQPARRADHRGRNPARDAHDVDRHGARSACPATS